MKKLSLYLGVGIVIGTLISCWFQFLLLAYGSPCFVSSYFHIALILSVIGSLVGGYSKYDLSTNRAGVGAMIGVLIPLFCFISAFFLGSGEDLCPQ